MYGIMLGWKTLLWSFVVNGIFLITACSYGQAKAGVGLADA